MNDTLTTPGSLFVIRGISSKGDNSLTLRAYVFPQFLLTGRPFTVVAYSHPFLLAKDYLDGTPIVIDTRILHLLVTTKEYAEAYKENTPNVELESNDLGSELPLPPSTSLTDPQYPTPYPPSKEE